MTRRSRPNQLETHSVSVTGGGASLPRSSLTQSISLCLTVAVPGEADPQVVMPGAVEVSDELYLGSAVHRRQFPV